MANSPSVESDRANPGLSRNCEPSDGEPDTPASANPCYRGEDPARSAS